MNKIPKKISDGVVHKLQADFKKVILANKKVFSLWEDITPLARNEWICWVESTKKLETRSKRIKVGMSKMSAGDRRPCCWEGCMHREKKL